jgi:hypothetical protein
MAIGSVARGPTHHANSLRVDSHQRPPVLECLPSKIRQAALLLPSIEPTKLPTTVPSKIPFIMADGSADLAVSSTSSKFTDVMPSKELPHALTVPVVRRLLSVLSDK